MAHHDNRQPLLDCLLESGGDLLSHRPKRIVERKEVDPVYAMRGSWDSLPGFLQTRNCLRLIALHLLVNGVDPIFMVADAREEIVGAEPPVV